MRSRQRRVIWFDTCAAVMLFLSNNLGHFIELTAKSINRRSGVCLCCTSLLVCLVFCRGKTETVLWFYGTVRGNLYSLSIIAKRSVGLRETFGQRAELQSTQLAYVAELPLEGLYMCCPWADVFCRGIMSWSQHGNWFEILLFEKLSPGLH